ncbi:uncharacterized protein LOC116848839 [Odontomachus brunneus]|uniref:uncharacterized protein LOC116848839 n=1 Tax=Odontomachus brunneus TaxID=486640 RepID=UPI0013F1DC62|nr:uncharacterized protein LOC116848839 [Odontomachus brunneus]
MDRKGKRGSLTRPGRAKKRKFCGNRHTIEAETSYVSTSAEKLRKTGDNELRISREHGYSVLNFFSVFSAISALVMCKQCKKDIMFKEASPRGLGFKIAVECSCGVTYINSCPLIDNAFEINRRIVLAMRLIGVGMKGLNLFCGIMDICQGLAINTYYACLQNIYCASETVYDIVTRRAIEEEREKNVEHGNLPSELTVSGDGTWKKRGFSSLFGVSTLVGVYSNKVIDTLVKSSFCQTCNLWKNKFGTVEYEDWKHSHQDECTNNHEGSADKMEVNAVKEMFLRSMDKYQVKYKRYVGDGDSKTFKSISETMIYGENFIVETKEYVEHVKKRMGARLRNTKEKNKDIGGEGAGKLTDKIISELSTYYGLAIRRNPESVEEMKNAIWATFDHERSTDENPHHERCPEGFTSWCAWRKAEAAGTLNTFTHDKIPLNDEVLNVIRPIYEDLTTDDLLQRCLGSFTQHNNESLNSLIWTIVPKHLHCGKKTVEVATFLAVCLFNEGFHTILKIMDVMGLQIGQNAKFLADNRDNERVKCLEQRTSYESKEARIAKRQKKAGQHEFFEVEESLLYGPGITDEG